MKAWKELKPWKKLEEYLANYLGWKRLKKKHYGHSIPDLKGDGYTGDSKHHKKFYIHTLSNKMNQKYKTDIILFTKEKRFHYVPKNIRVTLNLDQFLYLLICKRKAEKMPKKIVKDKGYLISELKYKFNSIKKNFQDINKIFKKMEKK